MRIEGTVSDSFGHGMMIVVFLSLYRNVIILLFQLSVTGLRVDGCKNYDMPLKWVELFISKYPIVLSKRISM